MKVIDLLNKIANGKIDEETRYKFSPFDYCTIKEFFNRYIVDEENLNLEIIEENKKIKKISPYVLCDSDFTKKGDYLTKATEIIDDAFEEMCNKINEIIEVINNEYNK